MATLDIGCGWFREAHEKREGIGIDLYKGFCDVVADALNLPFREETFDRILIYGVLEHLDNPMKCLREGRRVATNGAHFEMRFPVEKRGHVIWLEQLIFEFPFSIRAVIIQLSNHYKIRHLKGARHQNLISPDDVARILKIQKVEVEPSNHSWFHGRKGKLFRKLVGNPPELGILKHWFIEATLPT